MTARAYNLRSFYSFLRFLVNKQYDFSWKLNYLFSPVFKKKNKKRYENNSLITYLFQIFKN